MLIRNVANDLRTAIDLTSHSTVWIREREREDEWDDCEGNRYFRVECRGRGTVDRCNWGGRIQWRFLV